MIINDKENLISLIKLLSLHIAVIAVHAMKDQLLIFIKNNDGLWSILGSLSNERRTIILDTIQDQLE